MGTCTLFLNYLLIILNNGLPFTITCPWISGRQKIAFVALQINVTKEYHWRTTGEILPNIDMVFRYCHCLNIHLIKYIVVDNTGTQIATQIMSSKFTALELWLHIYFLIQAYIPVTKLLQFCYLQKFNKFVYSLY